MFNVSCTSYFQVFLVVVWAILSLCPLNIICFVCHIFFSFQIPLINTFKLT